MLRYFLSFFVALTLILLTQSFVQNQREAQYAAREAKARVEAEARAPKPLPALTDSLATLSQPALAKRASAPARPEPQFIADPARLNPGTVVPARSQPVKEVAAAPAPRRAAATPSTEPAAPRQVASSKPSPAVAPPVDPMVAAAIAQWAPLEVAPAAARVESRAILAAVIASYAPSVPQASPLPAFRLEVADFTAAAADTLSRGALDFESEAEALLAWMPPMAPQLPAQDKVEPAASPTPEARPAPASQPRIESLLATDLRWSLPAGPEDVAFSALTLLVAYAPCPQTPVEEASGPRPLVASESGAPAAPVTAVTAAKRRLSAEEVAGLVARLERSEQERIEPAILPVAAVRRPKGMGLLPIMNPSSRPLQPGEDPLPEADEPVTRAETKALPPSAFKMPLGLRWGWQSKRVLRFNAFSFPEAEIEQQVIEGGDGAIAVRGITECGPWDHAKYEFGRTGLRKAVFVHEPTGPQAPAQAAENMRNVRDSIRNLLGAGEVVLRYEAQPSKADPTVLETLSIVRWVDGDTMVQLDHFAAEQGGKRYDAVTLTCTHR